MLTKLEGRSTPTMPERLNKGKTVMSQHPPVVGQVSLSNITIIIISITATVIITTISTVRTFLSVTHVTSVSAECPEKHGDKDRCDPGTASARLLRLSVRGTDNKEKFCTNPESAGTVNIISA